MREIATENFGIPFGFGIVQKVNNFVERKERRLQLRVNLFAHSASHGVGACHGLGSFF
jgi:hypothetical protein